MPISNSSAVGIAASKFGAIGSGVETTKLQAAIDGAAGGKLILDGSKTDTAGALTISSGIHIEGNGATLVSTQTNGMAIQVNASDVHIDGLNISGSNICRGAISFNAGSDNCSATNNKIFNYNVSSATNTQAIYFDDCDNLLIQGNDISECDNAFFQSCRAIRGGGTGSIVGLRISDNNIHEIRERTDGDGIAIQNFVSVEGIINGNSITNCAKRGIKIQSPGMQVSNNHINMPSMPGESLLPRAAISILAKDTSCVGNHIEAPDGMVDGVIDIAQGTQNVQVNSNFIYVPVGHGQAFLDAILVGDGITWPR